MVAVAGDMATSRAWMGANGSEEAGRAAATAAGAGSTAGRGAGPGGGRLLRRVAGDDEVAFLQVAAGDGGLVAVGEAGLDRDADRHAVAEDPHGRRRTAAT